MDTTNNGYVPSGTNIAHVEPDGNHNVSSPYPIQGNPRPLTILDQHTYFYPCQLSNGSQECNYMIQPNARSLFMHLKEEHGVQSGPKDLCGCPWKDCLAHVQYNSLARHLITHLGVRFRCLNCATDMTRLDCARAHQKKNRACLGAALQVIPGPSAHTFT